MSKVIVDNEMIADIADAIRVKIGNSKVYKLAEMPDAIRSIEGGDSGDAELWNRYNRNTLTTDDIHAILDDIVKVNNYVNVQIRDNKFQSQLLVEYLHLPEGIYSVAQQSFAGCINVKEIILPKTLYNGLQNQAFARCIACEKVVFQEIPTDTNGINYNAFYGCEALKDIYVPWLEGEVANAPWGAENATIHYGYRYTA